MVLGLVASVVLAQGSLLHAIGMVVLGLLLGLIGTDVNSGTQRFTFGIFELADGIGFVTVAMGMFGLGEIIRNLQDEEERSVMVTKITGLWPTKRRLANAWSRRFCAARLSARRWEFFLAAVPSSVRSPPTRSKKRSRRIAPSLAKARSKALPRRKSANNAGAQTSFIPIAHPGNPVQPGQRADGRSR